MRTVQLSLFTDPIAALEGCESSVKAAMAEVAAASTLSREQGCDRMNGLAQPAGIRLCANADRLSLAMFEKWLNPDAPQMPGVKAIQVFCCVYRSSRPWEVLLEAMGKHALGPDEMHFYKVGKDLLEFEKAKRSLKASKERAKGLL